MTVGDNKLLPLTETAGRRWAVTMWEFSWLVRRSGAEAEYSDWDKVLDELAERGYNCIRMDCFPHLIAPGADGRQVERFEILPQKRRFMWGNHRPVSVEPRSGLVDFITRARQRDIYVGLSTWFNDDSSHRRAQIQTPADYARIWSATLELLEREALLDRVVWVDLCNEFPLDIWAYGAAPAIFGERAESIGALLKRIRQPLSEQVKSNIQRFFTAGIAPLRRRWPQLNYTYSFSLYGADAMRSLNTDAFDLLEPHIWTSDDKAWRHHTWQTLPLALLPLGVRLHAWRARRLHAGERDDWLALLEQRLDYWSAWAGEHKLPLVTSEAWGPVNYDDVTAGGGEWDWVKDICAEGVRMACDKGWRGVCTSNFCQPHFEGMWGDIGWHRRMTDLIRG